MTNTVIIIGAKSDIAKAAAIQFAKNDFDLLLVGRDVTSELNQFGQSITEEYGQEVILQNLDIIDKQATNLFLNGVKIIPNGVVSFVGLLGEHQKAINDPGYAETIFKSNFNAIVPIINFFAKQFENQSSGFIIGVSSVSSVRGRKSNYYYGAAKAGFTTYLSGLRNHLYEKNVQVITVLPGYVDTKMTKRMDLPKWLTVSPEFVGRKIFNAYRNKKDIIYVPGIWKIIMGIISFIPERIFKRLNL
tara:strand:+ start:9979 stop:10716 length:738 start_codon:yes stop_codon:yes gene_type:complete